MLCVFSRRLAGDGPERLVGGELLSAVLARETIIAVALVGALMVMMGNIWRAKGRLSPGVGKVVVRAGYGLSWGSLALFLIVVFGGL